MADRKHTHTGRCQICDSRQAVDVVKGTVAKHGYTKRWGFFTGTCWGAGHEPLETNKDLLAQAIALSGEAVARFQLAIDIVTRERGVHGYINEWVKGEHGAQGNYQWVRVVFTETPYEHAPDVMQIGAVEVRDGIIQDRAVKYDGYGVATAAAAAAKARRLRIDDFKATQKQHLDYIKWQTERLHKWHATPLLRAAPKQPQVTYAADELVEVHGRVWRLTRIANSNFTQRRTGWWARWVRNTTATSSLPHGAEREYKLSFRELREGAVKVPK